MNCNLIFKYVFHQYFIFIKNTIKAGDDLISVLYGYF